MQGLLYEKKNVILPLVANTTFSAFLDDLWMCDSEFCTLSITCMCICWNIRLTVRYFSILLDYKHWKNSQEWRDSQIKSKTSQLCAFIKSTRIIGRRSPWPTKVASYTPTVKAWETVHWKYTWVTGDSDKWRMCNLGSFDLLMHVNPTW